MISGICLAMAFDRLGVGGIGAHVDAAFPLSFQYVGNLQRHLADVLDLDLDRLAVLKRPEALVIGAAGNEINQDRTCTRPTGICVYSGMVTIGNSVKPVSLLTYNSHPSVQA
jgi:hypothetical protein